LQDGDEAAERGSRQGLEVRRLPQTPGGDAETLRLGPVAAVSLEFPRAVRYSAAAPAAAGRKEQGGERLGQIKDWREVSMRYLLYLLGALFLASLLTGVTEIRPGERAVIRRFGRVLDDKPGPGLYIGLPWGLDQVDRVQVDLVRRVEVGYQPNAEDT